MTKFYQTHKTKISCNINFLSLRSVLFLFFTFFGVSTVSGQIAQRGTATTATSLTTSITINKPTGVLAGDIMLVNISSRDIADNSALSNPSLSGWTIVQGAQIEQQRRWGAVLFKIATAAEPASYTFLLDADSDSHVGAIVAFSGVNNITPFDVASAVYNTTNSNTVSATGLTTVNVNAAIIMFGVASGNATWSTWSTTNPSGLTELYDTQNTNVTAGGAWAIKTATGATGNGTATLSSGDRNGAILVALRAAQPPPTITSFTPSNACASSSQTVVITGTSFTGATAVTIGGTAAASYIINSATQITATIGAGTTGTIAVTTGSGTATSGSSFTVNPLPATILGGAATICTSATSPAFTNVTAGGTWSTSNSNATINASGVVTGINPGAVNIIYTLPSTCYISRAINIITTPNIITNPSNNAVGNGGNTSFNVVASSLPTSYTWELSTNSGGSWSGIVNGGVYSNATTATLNITGATLGMNGYFYRVRATNACGTSSFSASAILNVNNLVIVTGLGTNNVTCGSNSSLVDHANAGDYGNNRNDWTALNATSASVININGTYDVESTYDFIYLRDGVGITGTILATFTNTGTINYTGNPGQSITVQFTSDNTVVRPGFNLNVTYTGSCNVPCTAPTAPTVLNLTATGTIISGSFTHAVPQPNNYLVVVSTNATAPTPANGTTYNVGSTIGAGYNVISNNATNTLSASGLTNSTLYYIYIFSNNNLCIGGPLYSGPLSGSITTTGSNPYCIPSAANSNRYIDSVTTAGYITNINNSGTGQSLNGYSDYTASTPITQIPGGGVTLDYKLKISRQFVKVWVDWDNLGTFTDAAPELVYTTSGVPTIAGSAGFVIPIGTPPGNYRIRIRSYEPSQTFGPCDPGFTTGETEDYRLIVIGDCIAKLVTITDGSRCNTGTVNLNVTGTSGVTQFRFYDAIKGGNLIGTSTTGAFTTPSIVTTTNYYVTAFNGTCESNYREKIVAKVNPTTVISFTTSTPAVCGENNIVSVLATGDVETAFLINENFETGTFNSFTRVNVAADANTEWAVRTSPYVPTGSVWKPAITSRNVGNRYALAISDFGAPNPKDTQLRSINLNASTFNTLTLNFRHYFSYYDGETQQFADVEVSTDGGTAWTRIRRFSSTEGFAGEYKSESINMNAYAGQPQVMVRFRYNLQGSAFCDGWAIDDVELYGTKPLNTTFTWSGGAIATFIDAVCTIPYVAQAVTTVYVRPAGAQINSASWSFTATATLGNGCPVSQNITINNNTKSWVGTNNNWNDANNWVPSGVPTITNCIVIPSSAQQPVLGAGASGAARNLEVKSGGILEVNTSNSLTIKENININSGGTFRVRNNSSLVQIDNVPNTIAGTFTYDRTAPLIKGSDYVYWSSPVANQDMNAIYTTPISGPKYQWNTTATNANGGLGTWGTASGIMAPAKGYIMRGSSNYGMVATNLNSVFTGAPNNGNLLTKALRGNMVPTNVGPALLYSNPALNAFDDNWTLVGNPYPSAINALQFLSTNSTELLGNVRLWRHLSDPAIIASPFYQTFTYNYNSGDYLTVNFTGPTTPGASDIIKAGQAFLVQRVEGPQDLAGIDVIFNNAMRLTPTGTVMNNSSFFRNSDSNQEAPSVIERNRIWLDIVDGTTNASETTLVGYVSGATANFDSQYDATIGITNAIGIYSITDNQKCIIQGKAVPFVQEDIIPIGINVQTNGQYHIAIKSVDGLFLQESQTIYLEDRVLNVLHNLKTSPYTFTANSGNHDNRFVLRYAPNVVLSNNEFVKSTDVKIFRNDKINIVSGEENISDIKVYDILGKLLYSKQNNKSKSIILNELSETRSLLIVKVTLENKEEIVKKIIF